MRFVILCFVLVCVCRLNCAVKAQAVKCVYEDDKTFYINEINLRIPYYTCNIDTSSLNYGTKPTSIAGNHQNDKTDDDVKYVINYNNQVLQTLTSIFCEKFKNVEAIAAHMKLEFVDENAFWKCKNLKRLQLHSNNFRQLPANLLAENGKLQTILIIENSQLSSLPENFFANQNQVELLTLHTNNFSSLPSGIFEQLGKLKLRLEISTNNFEVIDPKWFENLINLEYLNMQRNKLTDVPKKCFESLKNLKKLSLDTNKISTLHADSFFGLDNLEILSIWNNQLTDLPSGVFSGLRKLEQLFLGTNKLATIHSDSFGSLTNLWKIDLADNKVNSIDEKIVDSTALKSINMTNNICYNGLIKNNRNSIKPLLKTCFSNYKPRSQPTTGSCGRSEKAKGTIIGGTFITKGEFPWLAVLAHKKTGKYFCGGVLVSKRKVLTAAHCMQNKWEDETKLARSFIVALGTHDLDSKIDLERVNYAVQQVNIHPDWNPGIEQWDADIAVLYLGKDVTFTPFIQPICLIPEGSPVELITQGMVVGYGKSENSTNYESIAKVLEVPIVGHNECFRRFPEWKRLSSRRTFCGGWANGTGSCLGDSGGGMYVKYDDTFYLRGIISASFIDGPYGCDVDSLSIFTDVLFYHDWIEKTRGNEYFFDRK